MPRDRVTHLDADAFFASVEQASDPRLRGRPVAVGGEKRGIIASASYEARKFGVYTPMPTVRARRLCPKLVVLPGDFEKYERFSRWMFSYAYDFTPDVEVTSIDEGYFDLGAVRRDAADVARAIRDAIQSALKITVSEGIGSNKLVSQVASKLYKPAGFHEVATGGEIRFLHPLENKWLPGVGPKTAERLNAAGLVRIEHVAATPVDMLELLVGSAAAGLRRYAHGIDERPVVPVSEPAKSYGQQETFAQDQTNEEFIEATLRRMADELFAKVRADGKSVRTLTVKVRYNDMAEDQRSESLAEPTDLETDVYGRLRGMLREAWKRRVSLRLVSLKLSNLYEGIFRMELALDRGAEQQEAQRRLAKAVDTLREEKGRYVVFRGHDFVLRDRGSAECGVRSAERGGGGKGRGSRVEGRGPKDEGGCNPQPATPPSHSELRRAGRNPHSALRTPHSALGAVPLLVRSHYSFMNSTLSPEAIVGLAKARGQRVVALCDQGNLHGAVALVQAAKEAGIRPVLGAEIQVGGKPLWLFVENARGYANLCRLLSECGGGAERREERGEGRGRRGGSKPDGKGTNIEHRTSNAEHRTPDIEHPLRTPSFAHRASEGRPHFLLRPPGYGGQAALRTAEGLVAVGTDPAWAEYFPGRFYLGVRSAEALRRMPGADQLPCVAIAPVCYAQPRDRWKLEIVQSIRTLTLLRQAHPEKLAGGERHYPLAGEWEKEFKERPDLLRRTQEIAERCAGFELPLGAPQFPAFRPPDGSSPREFLRQLVFAGAQARYGGEHGCDQAWVRPSLNHDQGRVGVPADRTPGEHAAFERKGRPAGPRLRSASHGGQTRALPTNPQPISNLQAQIELELQIIHDVGYEEYFLVVWDILQGCRREGIHWITRGSAADSLVCYCLGISDVCPIRFDLYFRRFLNKERMALHKLPDIDVDFPHDRKDDVIDLVFAKYGAEHCAVVGGFSTFQARSAFAEVAKVLGVAEREVRRFTEHFPWSFGGGWEGQGGSAECGVRSAECGVGAGRAEGRGPNEEATTCNQLTPHSLLRSRSFGGQAALRTSSVALRAMEDRPHSESGLIALLRASPECRDLPLDEEPYRSALIMAECLDGVPRYPKMHPCGVVLSRQPMHELTPTFVSGKGYATTHFDMDAVEAVGLVKIDILAQGGLAVMRDAAAMLQERGVEVDLVQCGVRSAECGVRSAECGVRSAECGMGGLRVAGCGLRVGGTEAIEGRGPRAEGTAACDPRIPNSELRAPSSGLQTPSYDDPLVWDMIASGGARAVHHIESPAMTSLCRMTNVREIDGLIAIVSVIRPGAANEQKKVKFTRRYQGLEAPEYPHPSLEPCLRSTFGLVVYEEHILQMCEAFAGINPGRADVLRRALVKRKWRVVEEIGREFVTAARARGHADLKIREVWELVTGFNGYAFCKAHSTAYGVEAYQSAWLKCYFPAEFMAAVLSNGKGFYRPLVYVLECHRLGIALRPPSVNRPGPQYRVESGEGRGERGDQESGVGSRGLGLRPSALGPSRGAVVIRVPVGQIKGLGERMLERLHGERKRGEFRSLADFYRRVAPLPEEMETLIRAGALDEFGQSRTHQFWEAQWLHRRFGQEKSGQGWLFESAELGVRSAELGVRSAEWGQGGSRVEGREAKETATCNPQPTTRNQILPHSALPTPHLEEPSRKQRLLWETELLGFAASGHPLELFDDVAWETYCPVTQLGEHVGEEVVVCGLIIEDRVHHQATGEPMKFLTLCDWTGMVETELFASTYKAYGLATVRYPVLEIAARVEPFENGRGHTLRVLRAGKPRKRAPGSSAGGRFASGPPGLESAGRPVGPALVGSGMDRPRAGRSSRD